ncbi:MAG: hypothetical protein VX349_04035 [Pseudomonadota bacterium]|nr:hypothetical protein [Pseudomonadota bacterium]
MTNLNRFRRWLVVVPLTLFAVLVWDVTSRLIDAEKTAQERFVRGFEVDASRREGMRDLLARDVQSALMYALHNLSDIQTLSTNEERAKRLTTAFEQLGVTLRNSRYDFVEVFLTEETVEGKLVLRGRYPSAANLGEIDPTDTPLFAHVDQSKAELFSSDYEIYTVESDPLLLITDAQPVLVNTRLIVDGSEGFSSWYLSVRAGFNDLHESIDLIGQQMAGGVTPMRVISFDARTDVCQTVWEVGKGVLDCDEAFSAEPVDYQTVFSSDTGGLAYSLYQPTDAYRQSRLAPVDELEFWRPFLPAALALVLLLTTISYVRYRSQSEGLMSSFTRSISDKDSLNSSIHEVLSSHLEIMSRFAYAMRQKDVQGEERRYFDIAISEFLEASLSLNTLILERPPVTPEDNNSVPDVDLKDLTELAQMALEVATVDTSLETKFFVPEDFPKTIPGYAYSVQTAVIAAINLSAQGTEEGRIEVSLWVDSEGPSPCLYLRVTDTGIGWGDLSDNSDSRAMTDDNIALRAFVACLKFSGTTIERQSETDLGNEYVLKLCNDGEV